jgi:uncharacterized protein
MPALHTLDRAECERLLRRRTFGRVALVTPDGPEILPVNYAVHAGCIVIRTSPDGVLARHADQADLVFQIDLVDDHYWSGWSVVARGRGEIVAGASSTAAGVRPWADGDRSSELRLPWTELTGRRVGGPR